MANPKTWRDLFDFSDSASVQGAIKVLNAINKSYNSLIQTAVKGKTEITNANKALVASLDAVEKETKSLDETNKKDQQTTAKRNAELLAMNATYKKQADQIKFLNSQITKLTNERNAVSKKTKDLNNINKEAIALEAKLGKLTGESAKQNAALRLQVSELRKVRNQEAKETAGLVTIYDKQVARLNKLTKEYKAVAFEEGIASKRAKELSASLTTLRTKITNVEQSAGQFQRGVGGYRQALTGLTAGFRQLAGALGFTGLIFGLVAAFKNVVTTIRDFDKELNNLASISGKSRSELSDLEKTIREVAKTSVNTANEVAKTATALVALGKTESEIKKLLKPVNDLSIALQAPADEAGELLIQTLNAFGESADSAQEYADIIAKVRSSTALDFQRIKDALGFLAPTAQAAGVSFEKTGAVLGTLVDNGIKASRAGRLLSSSFLKLADEGLTLDQALSRINKVQSETTDELELLSASSQLFGKESAALGLILASNIDKVDSYTESFENAGGALDELTTQQLESLDAKIKILDSAWTEFILTIESGEGVLGNFAKDAIDFTTDFITALTNIDLLLDTVFTSFDNLSNIELRGLLDAGLETDSGKEVLDFFKELENLPLDDLITDIETYRDAFVAALVEEGETAEQSTKIFNAWAEQKQNAFKAQQAFDFAISQGVDTQEAFTKKYSESILAFKGGGEQLKIVNGLYDDYNSKVVKAEEVTQDLGMTLAEQRAEFKAFRDSLKGLEEIDLRTVAGEAEDAARRIEEANKRANEGLAKQSEDLLKLVDKDNKARLRSFEENKKKEVEAARVAEEQKQVIQDTAFEAASLIGNQLVTNSNIRLENELVNLEKQKTFELELAGENSQKRAQIEEEFAEKEKAIKIKQAKNDKKQALFNIALNTAESIVKVAAQTGILAPFAIPAIAAIGALQAGLVASQPLPAFEKGGIVDTDGPIITSEKGREMAVTPSGNLIMTGNKGPEVRTDIPKGSAILNNAITEGLLKKGFDQNEVNEESASSINKVIQAQKDRHTIVMMQKMERENDILIQTLKGLKSDEANQHWGVSHGRLVSTMKRGSTRLHDWKSKNRD